jgi:hypothetical protein
MDPLLFSVFLSGIDRAGKDEADQTAGENDGGFGFRLGWWSTRRRGRTLGQIVIRAPTAIFAVTLKHLHIGDLLPASHIVVDDDFVIKDEDGIDKNVDDPPPEGHVE